jgi:hypothetical protein
MEGESLYSKYGPRIANSLSPINCSYYEVTVVTAVEDDDDYTKSQSMLQTLVLIQKLESEMASRSDE